jgi:hypothetical protein
LRNFMVRLADKPRQDLATMHMGSIRKKTEAKNSVIAFLQLIQNVSLNS